MAYATVMTIAVCALYGTVERYILLVLMGTAVCSTIPVGASFAATTFRDMPPEARTVAVAVTGVGTQLGNFYGAYLFPAEAAPKHLVGFGVIAGTQGGGRISFPSCLLPAASSGEARGHGKGT